VENRDMNAESTVTGAIIDSWVEPSGASLEATRLVLQVAPNGRPEDLLIVEAATSLVGDRGWLEDLGENLCHGSPVAAVGQFTVSGLLNATQLRLAR
jgi:hypothetical protein